MSQQPLSQMPLSQNQGQGFSTQNMGYVVNSPLGEPPGSLGIRKHPHDGYDPSKSTISSDAMQTWIKASVTGNLREVPGIGEVIEGQLMNEDRDMGVSTTFQLIGKFLSFRRLGGNQIEQCNAFWGWLKSKNISHNRNNIVQAIAEKCNVIFPGIYDESLFIAANQA